MDNNSLKDKFDIYLYGMTVLSTMHLLEDIYPEADTYGEIKESHIIPGGETANAAIILSKLGCKVKIDGPFLGVRTRDKIFEFCSLYNIDCKGLYYDVGFEGVQDMILIDKNSRTIFGKFQKLFGCGVKRWTKPDREGIKNAKVVSIDPFFGDESILAAQYCIEEGKKYITIDCKYDSILHENAAATVISNEYIQNEFKGQKVEDLFRRFTDKSEGLVIFTFGSKEIIYGRKGEEIKRIIPYRIEAKSTLGAGDTFRAGVVYGIYNNMSDEEIVRFAAATAACVCMRFPMALNPPSLDEIMKMCDMRISD